MPPLDAAFARPHDHPRTTLVITFAVWKLLLCAVAALSPGEGYDTSAWVLVRQHAAEADTPPNSLNGFIIKFVRWDAIYFLTASLRGYVFEQEWAFSWSFASLISQLSKLLGVSGSSIIALAGTGILLSNISHLLSSLVLYQLVLEISSRKEQKQYALLTALLHILSPGGLFLSAPYGESLFSLLNFLGFLLYFRSRKHGPTSYILEPFYSVGAGISFALATTIRSNGLLSASVFLYDLLVLLPSLPVLIFSPVGIVKLGSKVLAGLIVAMGSIVPQWIAFEQYCTGTGESSSRPWCQKLLPSIYSWVQSHYWGVGFLRYWTVSNLPLFLLAGPLLYILLRSALRALIGRSSPAPPDAQAPKTSSKRSKENTAEADEYLRRLAVPQLMLGCLALTNFHVQIINRISSGYPLWYLAVAMSLTDESEFRFFSRQQAKWVVFWIIMYGMIQGGLFASFLPPA